MWLPRNSVEDVVPRFVGTNKAVNRCSQGEQYMRLRKAMRHAVAEDGRVICSACRFGRTLE